MASQALNLIKAVSTDVPPVNLPPNTQDFLKDFPGLTSGMGKYKDELARIHIDESVKPVAQPHYRIHSMEESMWSKNTNSLKMMTSLNV